MSERDGYQFGVPCWIDTARADPERTAAFYAKLLGWEVERRTPPGAAGPYLVATLRGRDVAGIAAQPSVAVPPDWTTHVWVDSVADVVASAEPAGGSLARAPSDAFDGGRSAVIADPAGAVIGLWQPGSGRGAELVNEPGAWAMSVLSTPDAEGAERFYGAVFGWETEAFDGLTMLRLPGFVGGEPEQPVPRDVVAVMAPAENGAPARWQINVWVHDADAVAAAAVELGGTMVAQPADGPGMREAVVADLDGVTVSISQLLAGP